MSATPQTEAAMSATPQTEATMSTTPQTGALLATTPPRVATPSTPPGFPSTPQYPVRPNIQHNSPHLPVSLYEEYSGMISPISANLKSLGSTFNNADLAPNVIQERLALFDCDAEGEIEVDTEGNNSFYLTEGYIYESGHGRDKCKPAQCLSSEYAVPNNCGYHQQFYFPVHFKPCGPKCRGGFCQCLRSYPDY